MSLTRLEWRRPTKARLLRMSSGFSSEERCVFVLATRIRYSKCSWSDSVHWKVLIGGPSSKRRVALAIVISYVGDDHMYRFKKITSLEVRTPRRWGALRHRRKSCPASVKQPASPHLR